MSLRERLESWLEHSLQLKLGQSIPLRPYLIRGSDERQKVVASFE